MSHWKETSVILIASSIIATILMAGQVVAHDEPVVNSGFETGDLTGWTPLRGRTGGSVTSAGPHTGTYSLELRNTDSVGQTFSPAVSTGGDLTFWLKCPSPGCGPLIVSVGYSDGSGSSIELEGGDEVSVDYAQFTVPVDNSKQVASIEFVYVPFLTGVFFLDDVSLGAHAKVIVCHIPPGQNANAHSITVSERAVPAHLAHGDTVGSCGVS